MKSRSRGVEAPEPLRLRGNSVPGRTARGPAELSTHSPRARKISSSQRGRRSSGSRLSGGGGGGKGLYWGSSPRRAGDAKHGLRGRNGVLLSRGDAVFLAGLLAGKELFVFAGSAPVHDVEIAVEVGAEAKADPVVLRQDQPRVHGFPFAALEQFQGD